VRLFIGDKLSTKLCWLERDATQHIARLLCRALTVVTDIEFDWYMRVTLLSTELHTPAVTGVWNA